MPARKGFWWVTAAAVLGVVLTLLLGNWQLNRAAEKLALQAAIDARQQMPAVDNAGLLSSGDSTALFHRTVRLRGHWRADLTVFLDNRQMAGRPGLFVMTPLQLRGSRALVMVQRGWVPRNFIDRSQTPQVATPGGEVEVVARVAPPPSKLYEFKGGDNGVLRQNIDLAEFARATGTPVLTRISVIETAAASDGLARAWPAFSTGVDKHYGYAFQWFGLSALVAILYVWFQFIRPRRAAPRG